MKLSERMVTMLEEWKEKQLNEWQKRSPLRDPNTDLVFTELDGTPLDETYISRMLKLYAESSGIRKKLGPENLHQTFWKRDS